MRVALCLSGQIRSFNHVQQSLRDFLITPYNCDVFCHFWHKYDGSSYQNFYNYDDPTDYGSFKDYKLYDIFDFLKPTSIRFDFPSISENAKSMLRSIAKSNDLKKEHEKINNFKYDLVVRARWDLLYTEKINLHECKNNEIYLIDRPGGCGGVNDWFAYGTSETMDEYANVYYAFENTDRIKQLCPEGVLGMHLSNNNINVNIISKTFFVVRADGVTRL